MTTVIILIIRLLIELQFTIDERFDHQKEIYDHFILLIRTKEDLNPESKRMLFEILFVCIIIIIIENTQ